MADTRVELILPDWPAPAGVSAVSSTRSGGVSQGRFESLNIGDHVGDEPERVAENRSRLLQAAGCRAAPLWLDQVHGTTLFRADTGGSRRADAAVVSAPGAACVIMTADCLPILVCDGAGSIVAGIHAGWRGLAAGVIDSVASALRDASGSDDFMAWIGPAISCEAYEVGDDVREAMCAAIPAAESRFAANEGGRWQCDLAGIARDELQLRGYRVFGGRYCTHSDTDRFFSHRRDGPCGRQASLIWLRPD